MDTIATYCSYAFASIKLAISDCIITTKKRNVSTRTFRDKVDAQNDDTIETFARLNARIGNLEERIKYMESGTY